jgi:hypothetical protein
MRRQWRWFQAAFSKEHSIKNMATALERRLAVYNATITICHPT